MRIRHHRLQDEWFGQTRDLGSALSDLRFIVMHYTAGGSGKASRDYMMLSPAEKQARIGANAPVYASAHVVVDRDGSLWQIAPFNRMTRHAGRSHWRGLESLNRYAIGIEIVNYGWLDRRGDGRYGRSDTPIFEAADVVLGPMPNSGETKGWEPYPEAQLQAVERLTRSLLAHYPQIVEVLGHQEISPGRKFDPGPAFPLQRFRNLMDSRGVGARGSREPAPRPQRYATTTAVNIRGGAGVQHAALAISPLPPGTVLVRRAEQSPWLQVHLEGRETVQGWVHGDYLRLMADEEAAFDATEAVASGVAALEVQVELSEGAATSVRLDCRDLSSGLTEEVVLHQGAGRCRVHADGRGYRMELQVIGMQTAQLSVKLTLSLSPSPPLIRLGLLAPAARAVGSARPSREAPRASWNLSLVSGEG